MGGAAYLPDLDGAGTASKVWGPITSVLARAIGVVAGGHRNRTHDLILAPIAFGVVVYLASLNVWASLAVVALAVGLAAEAVGRFLPGDWKSPGLNFLFSVTLAYTLVHGGYDWAWLPWCVAAGVVVHVFGDSITVAGVPVPLTTLTKRRPMWGIRLFTAGDERFEKPITIACLIITVVAPVVYAFWPYLSKLIPGLGA
jgi:membrane-bound metal-dependent hydrolase YbcI (DUF457 family)